MAVVLPTFSTRSRVHAPVPARVDVAVIGAGLGGLVAAARLARAGRSVAVFDGHYVAGGCATMFVRGPAERRFSFDVGVHYVGDCGPEGRLPTVLRESGVDVEFRSLDPDGFDELIFPDLRFRVPADRDLFRDRLVAMFPAEKRGIDRYLRLLREVDHLGRPGAPRGWRQLWDATVHGRLAAVNTAVSAGEFLDSCTRDPKLRAVLTAQWGNYGVAPGRVSLMMHAGLVNHFLKGAYYPKGGGQVIADGLGAVIEAAGGTIHLRHLVEKIEVEGGRASGLTVRGPHGEVCRIAADVVVSNADYKRTMLELLPDGTVPAPERRKVEDAEMAGAIVLACVGVEGDLGALGMRSANYWTFDDYDFDSAAAAARQGSRAIHGAFLTSATRKDPGTPGHAPAGCETLEVMGFVAGDESAWGVAPGASLGPAYRREAVYAERKAEVEEALLAKAESVFPGLRSRIVFREAATPLTQNRYTRATDGTSYGLAAIPTQFLGNRPGFRGPLPGLYLAGASTRSGHGILGAVASGAQAARAVEKDRRPG